jgi:methylmalonyl-CoA mutase cobalamin-binding subunit
MLARLCTQEKVIAMNIQKQVDALNENINEMMASTAAVKGADFADAVAISFEAVQLMEVVGQLAAIASEDSKQIALALREAGLNIVASIATKACGEIADQDLEEIMTMGRALNKRRNDAMADIMKGLKDAND